MYHALKGMHFYLQGYVAISGHPKAVSMHAIVTKNPPPAFVDGFELKISELVAFVEDKIITSLVGKVTF